jgi:aspartate kinase
MIIIITTISFNDFFDSDRTFLSEGRMNQRLPLMVMKFGGAALATPEAIALAADRIIRQSASHRITVVVSAMGDETDRLLQLTAPFSRNSDISEIDTVLAAGEQVSAGLMALALTNRGKPARSFLAHQLDLRTDDRFGDGRILSIQTERLSQAILQGMIPVVAGFQGVNAEGRLVTLGRGGSDTSAVALAAALGAESCEFYKDVDGIYSDDPKRVPSAQRFDRIEFKSMEEIAVREPQILHLKAVKLASLAGIRLHVRSAFHDRSGTIIESNPIHCEVSA